MRSVARTLREEHHELVPHIAFLRSTADLVGRASAEAVREDVDVVLGFLSHRLIPHAELEDRILYPAVAGLLGSPDATRTMSRDHVEVGRLTDDLRSARHRVVGAEIAPADACELRRLLYGLHALVSLHFAKEEEIYLPLIAARLAPEEAGALAEAMENAGSAAHPRA